MSTTAQTVLGMVDYNGEEEPLGATAERVKLQVVIDSGTMANAINPEELPCDVAPEPNISGWHFVNAQGGTIEKFGSCSTVMEGAHGTVGCNWQIADIT